MASTSNWALPTILFLGLFWATLAPIVVKIFGWRANLIIAIVPLLTTLAFFSEIPRVLEYKTLQAYVNWVPELGLDLSLSLDGLSLFFAILISALGTIVTIYAGHYLGEHRDLRKFYSALMLFMFSMLGIILSDNLLLLYVFWELTTLSSFLLIGFEHEKEEARKNAWQAILVTSAGGLALLAGILLLGEIGGSYRISSLLLQANKIQNHHLYLPTLLLVLIGAFTKSAQFPFHFWLPSAMTAPTPVSAYLHSATMVKAGIYLLARLSPVLAHTPYWFYLVSVTGIVTMLTGSLLALKQTDLKLLLAYMTIMALGALTMLLGIGSPEAINAAVVFLLVHALYKGALFLIAGVVEHKTGTRDVLKLCGLYRKMPYTTIAALLCVLSMAGLPPLVGFAAKEMIYKATISLVGLVSIIFIVIAVFSKATSTAVSAIFFIKTFIRGPICSLATVNEVPVSMWIGPMILGLLSLLFGLFPFILEGPLIRPAVNTIVGFETNFRSFPSFELNLPMLLSTVSITAGLIIYALWSHIRRIMSTLDPFFQRFGPAACYDHALTGLQKIAQMQTAFLQSGNLRYYLLTIFSTTTGTAGYFIMKYFPATIPTDWSNVPFFEWAVVTLVVLGAISAVFAKSVLATVTSLGVVGYSIALIYVFYGAPDLALTQILVETLTIVIVALLTVNLPNFKGRSSSIPSMFRDAIVSIAFGTMMTALLWNVIEVPFDRTLPNFFAENSLSAGNGRNIVSVILVDFRALDTLGEITVLATGGLGVVSLLKIVSHKGSNP